MYKRQEAVDGRYGGYHNSYGYESDDGYRYGYGDSGGYDGADVDFSICLLYTSRCV